MGNRKSIWLNNKTKRHLEQIKKVYPNKTEGEIMRHAVNTYIENSLIDENISKHKRRINELQRQMNELEDKLRAEQENLRVARERKAIKDQLRQNTQTIQEQTIQRYTEDAQEMLKQGKGDAEILEALKYRKACSKGWTSAEEILLEAKQNRENKRNV